MTTQLLVGDRGFPSSRDSPAFGEALFVLRSSRGFTQRELARRAGVASSTLSEAENGRRPPPAEGTVAKLCRALQATESDRSMLRRLAEVERQSLGLRVSRSTPRHVADLLRDISRVGHQLSIRHVAVIRTSLAEVAMK